MSWVYSLHRFATESRAADWLSDAELHPDFTANQEHFFTMKGKNAEAI
jgi:hypothetical protein